MPNEQPVFGSVAAVTARRLDRGERVEIKINNGLERLGGRRVQDANRAGGYGTRGGVSASCFSGMSLCDRGPNANAVCLGVCRGEGAAGSGLATLQAKGLPNARLEPRTQSVQQTVLVVRDPTAQAMARLKELQSEFPGSDTKIGSCEKQP